LTSGYVARVRIRITGYEGHNAIETSPGSGGVVRRVSLDLAVALIVILKGGLDQEAHSTRYINLQQDWPVEPVEVE
jgi:hypothetical protein